MRKIKLFGISPFVLTIVFFLQALLFANNAIAQTIIAKPNPATLVTDMAGVLTPEQKQALENKLVAIDDSSSNQIAVVIVPSLDGYPKEEYATKLFNHLANIESLEGWTASKITKASDYLSSVYHALEYDALDANVEDEEDDIEIDEFDGDEVAKKTGFA